jgi:hypothetical protein
MTVSYGVPVWLDGERCRLSWSSDVSGAVFRVFRDGDLVSTTRATSLLFVVGPGESLDVEVLDDALTEPTYNAPGYAVLHWWPSSGAAAYRVEEFVEGAWSESGIVREDGRGFLSFKTRWLGDGYSGAWRVVPIGAGGLEGAAVLFDVRVVRFPAPPVAAWSAKGGGVVEVSWN